MGCGFGTDANGVWNHPRSSLSIRDDSVRLNIGHIGKRLALPLLLKLAPEINIDINVCRPMSVELSNDFYTKFAFIISYVRSYVP